MKFRANVMPLETTPTPYIFYVLKSVTICGDARICEVGAAPDQLTVGYLNDVLA